MISVLHVDDGLARMDITKLFYEHDSNSCHSDHLGHNCHWNTERGDFPPIREPGNVRDLWLTNISSRVRLKRQISLSIVIDIHGRTMS